MRTNSELTAPSIVPARIEFVGENRKYFSKNFVRNGPLDVQIVQRGIIPGTAARRDSSPNAVGVYSAGGEPFLSSALVRTLKQGPHVSLSPEVVRLLKPEQIAGEALYAGYLTSHFGHFLIESTSRLWWALRENFQGKIIFDLDEVGVPAVFALRFFEMIGLAGRIHVVSNPVQVEELYLPEQSAQHLLGIHPDALRSFRVALNAMKPSVQEGSGQPVYVSRTKLDAGLIVGEFLLEEAFAQEGFHVVHPQTLALDEQIRLLLEAPIVVGFAGSALHTLLFATQPKRVVYLCRERRLQDYLMIDQLLGNDSLYLGAVRAVPDHPPLGFHGPHLLDCARVFELLESKGILQPRHRPVYSQEELMRSYMAEWERQRAEHPRSHAVIMRAREKKTPSAPPGGGYGNRINRIRDEPPPLAQAPISPRRDASKRGGGLLGFFWRGFR